MTERLGPGLTRVADAAQSRAAVVGAYAVLGAQLIGTRLLFLGHSFWYDEIASGADYIHRGPIQIIVGPGIGHELFGVLAASARPVLGDSEIALRVWSVVPFVAGVGIVTAWLHLRVGALSGLLFLYLSTVSPLLLDITRQARGYGLAFLAMAALVVAALEAVRSGSTRALVVFGIAGALGTFDLPQFGIAFVATTVVLLTDERLRRRVLIGLGPLFLVAAAWWGPHLSAVRASAQIEDGRQIHGAWVSTAAVDQTVIPAFAWIDGIVIVPGAIWLPVILIALLLMGTSPLLRDRKTMLVLVSGVLATVLVLWLARAYVIPRYVSFLLVPILVLLATGMASILERLRNRPLPVRTVVTLVVLGVLAVRFATIAPDVVRFPREAYRDAARSVESSLPADAPVLAYMRHTRGLEFYLGRSVQDVATDEVAAGVCSGTEPLAYVAQPFELPAVAVPCLGRAGVKHYRFRQYARGGEMNVWIVPPAA